MYQERDFMQGFHNGDHTVWNQIWKAHRDDLLIYALKFHLSQEELEDVVISAYGGLWHNCLTLKQEGDIRPYLFASVKNGCLKCLKTKATQSGRQGIGIHSTIPACQ